jgi:pimeloyl-ACP methyl ester carboxylesterase
MAYAELSDVRCYYELIGDGPPLLLIPGLGCSCRVWDPAVDVLSKRFTVILIDNRGMGCSQAKRPTSTLHDYSADIVELLDHLQLDKVCVLGISLGGIIAQRFTLDHPGRVERLVLISCSDHFSPYLRHMMTMLGQILRRFSWEMFVRTVELLGTSPAYFDAHAPEVEQMIQCKIKAQVSRRDVGRQLLSLSHTPIDVRERISVPTLVVAGAHDALIPPMYARQMADRIEGSEFLLIEGAGHNPVNEAPDATMTAIVSFLIGTKESEERYFWRQMHNAPAAEESEHGQTDRHDEAMVASR